LHGAQSLVYQAARHNLHSHLHSHLFGLVPTSGFLPDHAVTDRSDHHNIHIDQSIVNFPGTGALVWNWDWFYFCILSVAGFTAVYSSGWLWIFSQITVWIGTSILYDTLLTVLIKFLYYQPLLRDIILVLSIGLLTGLSVGLVQQLMLQKRTQVRNWWLLGGGFGLFGGFVFNRFNALHIFMDPMQSLLISGLIIAVFTSLPALLIKPLEPADQVLPEQTLSGLAVGP
jgi:hypothetical protein